jgi:hypothetical protein
LQITSLRPINLQFAQGEFYEIEKRWKIINPIRGIQKAKLIVDGEHTLKRQIKIKNTKRKRHISQNSTSGF